MVFSFVFKINKTAKQIMQNADNAKNGNPFAIPPA